MTLSFAIGCIAHVFNPIIIMIFNNTPKQMRLMVRYVVGGVAILTSNYWVTRWDDDKHIAKGETYRLAAVMASVGWGVLIGHMVEELYYYYYKE